VLHTKELELQAKPDLFGSLDLSFQIATGNSNADGVPPILIGKLEHG
jgi:hypothetical protein